MKKDSFFLFALLISLVGNAIADWAYLWHSIKLDGAATSMFYIGQALGVVVLAPLLSVFLDKVKKKIGSILTDVTYALVLLLSIGLHVTVGLNSMTVFIVVLVLKGLSIIHVSGVVYSGIKAMADKGTQNRLATNMIATTTAANAIGMAVSGTIYEMVGLTFCLAIGIITFIPAILSYIFIFKDQDVDRDTTKKNYWQSLQAGLRALFADKVLLGCVLTISVFNIAGALIPVMLGVSLKATVESSGMIFGVVLGAGLLATVLVKNVTEGIAYRTNTYLIVPFTVAPCLVLVGASIFYPHPVIYALLYLAACFGSSMRNIATATLRVSRVSGEMVARVNTAYSVFLYLGQMIGGMVFIPAFQKSPALGASVAAFVFLAAIVISLLILPRQRLSELLKTNV